MQVRKRLGPSAVIAVGAAVLLLLAVTHRSGNPFTFSNALTALIGGVALGAIYSLAATGLVVTYTTSGVFNFAQGAVGMVMAFTYWQLTQGFGIPQIPALVVVVLVIAPLAGMLVERFAMRRAARSNLVVQLMSTVALTVFLMGLAAWVWNQNEGRSIAASGHQVTGFELLRRVGPGPRRWCPGWRAPGRYGRRHWTGVLRRPRVAGVRRHRPGHNRTRSRTAVPRPLPVRCAGARRRGHPPGSISRGTAMPPLEAEGSAAGRSPPAGRAPE
ncbi:MAG: hypothetical protein JO352_06025 [Chloroflexi bacterium]|nr:hypothetical protein [Chloroflexota bacterium]MBV9596678.1 hypothetical protein [Chloroflexota bacterium]